MKYLIKVTVFLISVTHLLGQNRDSLEYEIRKKQLKLAEEELEIKRQEFELKKEEYLENREDRKERRTEEKKRKADKEQQEQFLKKLMETNTNIFFCPLPLFVGGLEGGIEKRIAEKKSLRLMCGYYYNENAWYYRMAKNMYGGRINMQYRFYLDKTRPGIFGIYLAPEIGAKRIQYTQTVNEYVDSYPLPTYVEREIVKEANAGWGGFVFGVQEVIFKRISIDINLGACILIPITEYNSTDFTLPLVNQYGKGAQFKLALSLGMPVIK